MFRTFETPYVADWFAASTRWIVLVGLLASLALKNQLVHISTWTLIIIIVWNILLSVLAGLSMRLRRYHRRVVLGMDFLLAALFFWIEGGLASPVAWVTDAEDESIDQQVTSYPSGFPYLHAVFQYQCIPSGTALFTLFQYGSRQIFAKTANLRASEYPGFFDRKIAYYNQDGTVNLVTGSVDLTGTRLSLAMQLAETLGIPVEDVKGSVGDTESAGFADGSWGSRTTFSTGQAVIKLGQQLIYVLCERAADLWQAVYLGVVQLGVALAHCLNDGARVNRLVYVERNGRHLE